MNEIAVRFERALGGLRERFLRGLPQRLESITEALRTRAVRDLERGFHSLAGTAATYGYPGVAALAADGETKCATLGDGIDDSMVESLASLIEEIHLVSLLQNEPPPSRTATLVEVERG